MPSNNKEITYFDSCIFYSWLKAEVPPQRTQEEVDGIKELFRRHKEGQIIIATSVLTITEVVDCADRPFDRSLFTSLFDRPDFLLIETTKKIADIAYDIRRYYKTEIHPVKKKAVAGRRC